jgi:hypothetical protein
MFQLRSNICSINILQWYHIIHLEENIGGDIPIGGVIILPMIGCRGMILGGEIIGKHIINIT